LADLVAGGVAETFSTATLLLLEASVFAVSLEEALVEDASLGFATMVLEVVLRCRCVGVGVEERVVNEYARGIVS
jgi:hypothetical protein